LRRGRGGYSGGCKGGYNNRGNYPRRKRCFVCGKPDCWSTRHSHEERQNQKRKWRTFTQTDGTNGDFAIFLQKYEGNQNDKYNEFDAFLGFAPTDDDDDNDGIKAVIITQYYTQYHTAYGNINDNAAVTYLNNQAFFHGLIALDPYTPLVNPIIISQNPNLTAITIEPFVAHILFFTHNADIFKGIISDTNAASVSTAGKRQIRALQKKIPNVTIDTSTTGKYHIKFGNNPLIESLRTMGVGTFFGTIDFAIMPTNTLFLFYFANMKKHDVYLNSTRNVLVHNGKNHSIVMKNGHPWFLLNDLKGIVSHLTEVELR
jgi:hypothetical protein